MPTVKRGIRAKIAAMAYPKGSFLPVSAVFSRHDVYDERATIALGSSEISPELRKPSCFARVAAGTKEGNRGIIEVFLQIDQGESGGKFEIPGVGSPARTREEVKSVEILHQHNVALNPIHLRVQQ